MDLIETGARYAGEPQGKCRMLVVGLGGGGSNAVARMRASWRDGPDVAVVNTDTQALAACKVPTRLQIGRNLTQGLGAGGDPAVGKLAAEDDTDLLRELVSHLDVVFIVVTLGGGTGTGLAPILARIAREEGALTLCFATLPFGFEGERKKRQAEDGLRALRMHSDVVIQMPNERLVRLAEEQTSLVDVFGKADVMLGVGIRALWRLLSQTGIINVGFADLRHLVEHSQGSCTFGYGEGTGPNRTAAAIASLVKSPLLDSGNVLGQAGALLISIVGGSDLTLVDVQRIMNQVTSVAQPGVHLFMGATIDESWQDKIALTVLAAEHAQEVAAAEATEAAPAAPAAEAGAAPGKSAGKTRPGKIRAVQRTFDFDSVEKGKFWNTEPTVYEGQDLDIPTFIRRGIKLSFEK